MTGKLIASLRQAPATVPALAALVLFIVWAGDQAGYPVTHWAPGALIVLALLGIACTLLRQRLADIPLPVRVALAALAAYTALSYLSILWAGVPGDAWEGANRTLLYLLVFALFACWPQRAGSAALLLGGWTVAMIALAGYTALHIDSAGGASLQSLLPEGRLTYPSGYANANAAQWLMAFWPALLLARSRQLPWGLRGLLAGGAVLLAEVALLSQSRGSLYSMPVMVVLVFALLPGRVRMFALFVPVVAGVGVAAPFVLRVGDRLRDGQVTAATVHTATTVTLLAAIAVALAVALAGAVEQRHPGTPRQRARARRGVAAIALATVVVGLAGGLAAAGNPLARAESAWHSFKGGYGEENTSGSRLVGGLGSNRYDFYRVALDEFFAHPLLGIGADNFQEQYLAHARSQETPHYPHSVELRTLVETGAVGALIALVGLVAALLAGARALRGVEDPLARAVAAAALAGFAYWVVHGSFDWFWEFAGLGAPAFALLGLACALAPRSVLRASPPDRARATVGASPSTPAEPAVVAATRPAKPLAPRRVLPGVAAALLCVAAVASLAAPWFSQLQIESAVRVWTRAPLTAYSQLREAASLNPLSDEADLVAGDIALRFGDLPRAKHDFALALQRSPHDAYATLELGAIASSAGERATALELLARAVALEPRDEVAVQALRAARAGERVSVEELNRLILSKAQQLA